MNRVPPVNDESLAPGTRKTLAEIDAMFGQAWTITRVMARAPAVLATMKHLWRELEGSSLSEADREAIAMELAVANGCHYCVPAHRFTCRGRGLDPAPFEAIARGETLTEGRLAVIQRLVRRLVATGGALDDAEFNAFQKDGVTPQQMIEAIAEIAHCTVTNYMNRLAGTPLDDFLEPYRDPR